MIMSLSQTVVRTERLHKNFRDKEVLRGVELNIQRGQVVGLLGSNAAGKTTLIKCLLGLLKPSAGESELLGERSWNLSANAKARIGYVPQEVALLPWMNVQTYANYMGAFYQNWNHERVSNLLNDWDLPLLTQVGKLSVGQRQKLASILALGHDPELLIFDEPVASLDPDARRQFIQSLIELSEDEQHTVLFSTHIMSDVERVASHVAVMFGGQIEYFGELDALKDRIKKVRLRRTDPFEQSARFPEAIRVKGEGNHRLLSIDLNRVTPQQLAATYQSEVDVIDLNLEEIFLELNSGWRQDQQRSRTGARS